MLDNDSDVDGGTLALSAFTEVTKDYGTFAATTPSSADIEYRLNNASSAVQSLAEGQTVSETATYTINDGQGGTNTGGKVTVTITGINDDPTAQDFTETLGEGEGPTTVTFDAMDKADIRFRFPSAPRSGKVSIEAASLTKSYDDKPVFEGLDFILARQQKVAMVGKNGAGKTTLTRIFMGLEKHLGDLTIGHNVDIGYYAQNQAEELDGNLTVFETLDDVAVGEIRKKLRSILGAFLFSGEDADKKVKVLSGGEKARLALCKLLLHPYNLLILDEPTNHLDIRAKGVLKEALQAFDGTLIVVSHDRDFLNSLTELVYEVTPTGLKQYIGDIKQFLHEKHANSIRAYEAEKGTSIPTPKIKNDSRKDQKSIQEETKTSNKESYKARKERERQERKDQNRFRKLEVLIAEKEMELKEMNAEIAATGTDDRAKMTELSYKYETVQNELSSAMEEWTQLGEKLI